MNLGMTNQNDKITLAPMTRELFHELYRAFRFDPMLFTDMELYERVSARPFTPEEIEARFEGRFSREGTVTLAVMRDEEIIGEVVIKHIDPVEKQCEFGIHLRDDSVKGRGFGTRAEILAIEYAFSELGMETVLADCIIKNTRSRHIIEKLGFEFTGEKDGFRYYRLEKNKWRSAYGIAGRDVI